MQRQLTLACVALAVAACGPGYSKLKVDEIQSMTVAIDHPEQQFCAYQPVALRALVTYKDGKTLNAVITNQMDCARACARPR